MLKLRRVGEIRGPAPQYWTDERYRAIVAAHVEPLETAAKFEAHVNAKRREIVNAAVSVRRARALSRVRRFLGLTVPVAVMLLLVYAFPRYWPIAIAAGFALRYVLARLKSVTTAASRRAEASALEEARPILQPMESLLAHAICRRDSASSAIWQAWDAYCVSFPGYPPDWDERSRAVRNRDGRACTRCGWPRGYRIRRRNLHAHHRVPLSRGGDNSFENLVTLCHICHRAEDGPGHKAIIYRRRARQ